MLIFAYPMKQTFCCQPMYGSLVGRASACVAVGPTWVFIAGDNDLSKPPVIAGGSSSIRERSCQLSKQLPLYLAV